MNSYFQFKRFIINQDKCAMKVSTDSCLFGAWISMSISNPVQVLDIGAGTGLLMLMLAQNFNCRLDGIEIDEQCFSQLKENIDVSPWYPRLEVFKEDVRLHRFSKQYDLIVSNPPFYENQLASETAAVNTARHSTNLTIQELFNTVSGILNPEGQFAILIPFHRTEEIIAIAKKTGLFPRQMTRVRHSPSHPWYRSMIIFTAKKLETTTDEIDVRDLQGNYSPAFTELLKDYYLFL